jgi:L-threonylcarbamoyladenylate synthase
LSESESVIRAVNELRSGKLVAIPTETVYGLGADASNPLAIQRVYELKGRPTDHPLIVHVQAPLDDSQDKARDWLDILSPWVRHIPESAFTLFEHFWPGPLTLVFQKSRMVLKDVTGGQETIAIRSPSHPLAQELLRVFAGGIAAPSANRFGKISPSSAAHVRSEFKHHPDLMILDGGDCQFGIESTILDVSGNGQPCLLRPGSISPKQIKEETGIDVSIEPIKDQKMPRVSGSLMAHYAPNTPLHLYKTADLSAYLLTLKQAKVLDQATAFVAWEDISSQDQVLFNELTKYNKQSKWILVPKEPIAFAHGLYRLLRLLDQSQYQQIYIPSPPNTEEWDAIQDRLQRASFGSGPSSSSQASN